MNIHWVIRYLKIAQEVSLWSKDPSTKVGAIAIGKHGQILSQGYNGFPRKINDSLERLDNRLVKYTYTVHAEMNCIYNATLTGVSLEDAHLFVYGLPVCSECAKGIIQVGIKKVFMSYPASISDKWKDSGDITKSMFDEAAVELFRI
jgi:dCMP deaminase